MRLSSDRCENCNQKYRYYPVELFFHFRAMSDKVFNPYFSGGIGLMNWKVVDEETGELLQVHDAKVQVDESDSFFYHPGYSDSNEWVDFKGRFYTVNVGFGFEVFPIKNLGIDLGMEGNLLFGDDLSKAYLDSVFLMAGAYVRATFYYGAFIKDSDDDGVPDNIDKCPETPVNFAVDDTGCPNIEPVEYQTVINDLFDDSLNFKSEALEKLNMIAERIRAYPEIKVDISIYTHTAGEEQANLAKAEQILVKVNDLLLQTGVLDEQVTLIAKGETDPVSEGEAEGLKALNRRIVIVPQAPKEKEKEEDK